MESESESKRMVNVIDDLSIDVPATSDHLRVLRLVVSALGTAHGADLDDLEDLRIATGDVCAFLITNVPDGARLRVNAEVISVDGAADRSIGMHARIAGSLTGELDEISRMILKAACDGFGVETSDGGLGHVWALNGSGGTPDLRIATPTTDSPATGKPAADSSFVHGWFVRAIRSSANDEPSGS